jgi:hypothetical protein
MFRIRSVAKQFAITGAVLILMVVLAASASGDIPKKINYQGRLVDGSTGLPLAGPHSLVFRIYESASEGTLLWSETKTEEADSNGVFSTMLGSANPIDVVFAGPRWLEIEVDGQILTPRRELVSVPCAYQASNADMLDGMNPDAFADSSVDGHSLDAADGNPKDAIYVDDFGRVGVGTSTPTNFLDVRAKGSAEGGVAPYGEVVGHFRIAGSTAHTAISVDGQAGNDAIVYLAQEGEAAWDIRNDADIGNKLQIRRHTASGGTIKPVTIDTTGYVGVFTTSPNGPLHVESSININNEGATNFTNRIAQVVIGDGDGTGACILVDGNQIEQASPTHELYLNYNTPSDVILAHGGGNVGIGTTSPGAELEVAGQVKITGGSPAAGKVLSSDAGGLASWQALDVEYMVNPTKVLPVPGFEMQTGMGHLTIWSDVPDYNLYLSIPVDLQTKIAGVGQKFKSIKVDYKVAPGSMIYETSVTMANSDGDFSMLVNDHTHRTSTSWTSYTVTDSSPGLITGAVVIQLGIYFDETDWHGEVAIGNILVTTGP